MGGAGSAKLKAKATPKGKGKYKETYVPHSHFFLLNSNLIYNSTLICIRTSDDQADCQPLPKESYAVLKDRKIKDMLLAYQLPTTGDRNICIARHSRYVFPPPPFLRC